MRVSRALAIAPVLLAAPAFGQLLDVCASVNVNLFALLGLLNLGGLLDICLCISAVPVFVQTNVVASLAASLVGVDTVVETIDNLLIGAAGSQHCTFPGHCTPVCSSQDVCGFDCKDGYTKSGKDCVCAPPAQVCNGICTTKACPSGKPKSKRDMFPLEAMCPSGHSLCGVYNSYGSGHAWECINTQRNLESCGGCVTPLPGDRANGRDCTAIPGVANVECVYGECVISKCRNGWSLNKNGTKCLSRNGRADDD